MAAARASTSPGPRVVLLGADVTALAEIVRDDVAAVVHTPEPLPAWLETLGTAVAAFSRPGGRSTLPEGTRGDVRTWFASWLDGLLPESQLPGEVRSAVVGDVCGLADLMAELSGVTRFRVRALLEAPTTACGFHVDTVPPGAPPWGLLRVYNGAGTLYAEPSELLSLGDFHRYLRRRERLERTRAEAHASGDMPHAARAEADIADLDATRPFLRRSDAVGAVPAGSLVAFRHTDIAECWRDDAPAPGWIHCSPMAGVPRLVVNLTSPQQAQRPPRDAAPHPR